MANVKISELPTGQKVGNILDETLLIGGAATTATIPAATIPREDATTNTAPTVLRVRRTSSGTPANGIGAGIDYEVETAAGNNEVGMAVRTVATDVTAASEDFDFVVALMAAGATAVEQFRITSTGNYVSSVGTKSWTGASAICFDLTCFFGGASQAASRAAAGNGFSVGSLYPYNYSSTTAGNGTPDLAHIRHAAGVWQLNNGTTGNVRALQGGGSAVASATALPLPTGRVFHVTGTTTITSITSTNFQAGVVITLIFDGVLTFTNGNNLVLAGDFVTTANDTITLAFDGTNWYECSRSVN